MEIRNDILTMKNLYSRMTPFDLLREVSTTAEKLWPTCGGNLNQYYDRLNDEDKSKFAIFTSAYTGGNLQSLINTYKTLESICERVRATRPPTLMFMLQKGPNPVANIIGGAEDQINAVCNWVNTSYSPTDLEKISLGDIPPDRDIANMISACSSVSLNDFVKGKPPTQQKKESSKIRSLDQLQKILSRK